ncbi:MAG TPA: MmcQ/YjbR family DNA-binding protein [Bacteroidia bacterium]|nr:MmcQ/YjbR family DNA-binding protein [Bacteroidia bacterium]HNT79876.1 MmcQ/YjbR family DNA-binding protein [Bacteroidia bacterium]
MNIESLRAYCLSFKAVSEHFPFDETTLVFKVMDKSFLFSDITSKPLRFNVKCDPDKAIELRTQYGCVLPGYHMNKKHWNTIVVDGTVGGDQLKEWISDSYQLILDSLPKKRMKEYEQLKG